MVRGANLPPIIAWKLSNTLGSFSFSRSNLSLVCFGLLIFSSGEGGRSSSASCDHFKCLLPENFVFWQCSLPIGSASSLECNQSDFGVVHLDYARSIFWMLCDDQSVRQHKIVKGGKVQESWVLSHLFFHYRRVCRCLASFHKHLCPLQHSNPLHNKNVSDQLHSVAGHRILLFRCHHSPTLGPTLVLLWCWKGLPSGGWW